MNLLVAKGARYAASMPPGPVLVSYLTVGGAVVNLHTQEFTFTPRPRDLSAATRLRDRLTNVDRSRQVDGYIWDCLGCGTTVPVYSTDGKNAANAHASKCRAIPKPEVPR
jgi:hypothetical protein